MVNMFILSTWTLCTHFLYIINEKKNIKLEIGSVMLATITAGTSRTQMKIKMFAENNSMHITFDLVYF